MNRKQLCDRIGKQMPKQLNELEKGAYIMMCIGKEKAFSSQYYFSDKKTRDKIYEKARRKETKKLQNKKEIICVTASKLYKYIAEQNGLEVYYAGKHENLTKNNLYIFESGEHITPVIKLKDGRYIKTDIEWNLENIQTGMRWLEFGTKNEEGSMLSALSQDEIDNIMQKIGYIIKTSDYTDEYIKDLEMNLNNLPIEQQLECIFNDKRITELARNLKGNVERYRFYRRIIKDVTSKNENKKEEYGESIFCFGGVLRNKNKKRKYTTCVYYKTQEPKNGKVWIWSANEKRMEEVPLKYLKYFLKTQKIKICPGKFLKELKELKTISKKLSSPSAEIEL